MAAGGGLSMLWGCNKRQLQAEGLALPTEGLTSPSTTL